MPVEMEGIEPKWLGTLWAGQEYKYIHVTGSTNEECSRLLAEGASHGVTVAAGAQTAGKGRCGRSWDSPQGEAIYMSVGLKPDLLPESAPMITLVMALAVCRAIENVTKQGGFMIKWPNDIVAGGKKVCGILTQMQVAAGRIEQVVIGVGVNVLQKSFPKEIEETATSLALQTDLQVSRSILVREILLQFEYYYEKFVEKCDMSTIMGEYVEKLVNKEKEVRILDPKGEYTATALGINERGELLVEKEDGTLVSIYAGEVSVRGIYGYV